LNRDWEKRACGHSKREQNGPRSSSNHFLNDFQSLAANYQRLAQLAQRLLFLVAWIGAPANFGGRFCIPVRPTKSI
jgi:hypothetical protein